MQWLIELVILLLVFIVSVAILRELWQYARAVREFRAKHENKDLLVVYTSSPLWQPHIEGTWMQRWGERAVLLNRSEPDWNKRPEARLWRRQAGLVEHSPVAIVIPRKGKPSIIRFHYAFRDSKHGKLAKLQAKERELEDALQRSE